MSPGDLRTQNQPPGNGWIQVGMGVGHLIDRRPRPPALSAEVTGDVGVYRERLLDFVISQGITQEFKDSIAPALGMCCGDTMVLLPGQSPAEEFSTLVHELSHSLLGHVARRITTTKTAREPPYDTETNKSRIALRLDQEDTQIEQSIRGLGGRSA